jgi:hypothetical protein
VALLGADHPQEGGTIPGVFLPIHTFTLVSLGVNLLDNFWHSTISRRRQRV